MERRAKASVPTTLITTVTASIANTAVIPPPRASTRIVIVTFMPPVTMPKIRACRHRIWPRRNALEIAFMIEPAATTPASAHAPGGVAPRSPAIAIPAKNSAAATDSTRIDHRYRLTASWPRPSPSRRPVNRRSADGRPRVSSVDPEYAKSEISAIVPTPVVPRYRAMKIDWTTRKDWGMTIEATSQSPPRATVSPIGGCGVRAGSVIWSMLWSRDVASRTRQAGTPTTCRPGLEPRVDNKLLRRRCIVSTADFEG